MDDGFDAIAVRIENEGRIIAGAVLGMDSRGAIIFSSVIERAGAGKISGGKRKAV